MLARLQTETPKDFGTFPADFCTHFAPNSTILSDFQEKRFLRAQVRRTSLIWSASESTGLGASSEGPHDGIRPLGTDLVSLEAAAPNNSESVEVLASSIGPKCLDFEV